MLLLTRRLGEKIFIGKDGAICITLLSRHGNQVCLGIAADKSIPILREEIFYARYPEKKPKIYRSEIARKPRIYSTIIGINQKDK